MREVWTRSAEIEALEAEIERLREALRWIASEYGSVDEGVLAVARAALGEEAGNSLEGR